MNYDYQLIRSKRKSISVEISPRNEIIVRCPQGLGIARVEKFLEEKSCWIEKHFNNKLKNFEANSEIINFTSILIRGEKHPVQIGAKTAFFNGIVYIKHQKEVRKLITEICVEEFIQRFNNISLRTRLYAVSVSFKNYKGRWGCCSIKKEICFNFKIFMLPVNLQNYIIVHELCHIEHFNHSKNFWDTVSRFIPEYKTIRKRLKDYDFILKLY